MTSDSAVIPLLEDRSARAYKTTRAHIVKLAPPPPSTDALSAEPLSAAPSVSNPAALPAHTLAGQRLERAGKLLLRAARATAIAWLIPIALLVIWYFVNSWGWAPDVILPSPQSVAATLYDLLTNGEIAANLAISLQRVFLGFVAGALIGAVLGMAMGLSPTIKDYLYPTIYLFAQVPLLGWLPLLMMLVGIGEALKLVIIAKAVLIPVALNTLSGLQSVPSSYIDVARVLRFNRRQLLTKVVLPSALPPIWNGLRLGFTKAWLALVAVELLASSEGIGFMIVYGRQLMQLDVVLAAVVVVGLVGWTLDKALTLIEAHFLRWRRTGF